jgi:aminoglycoside 6'-N-acetyltransferase
VAAGYGELSFRPLQRDDFGLVLRWLRAPHVRRWWPSPDDPTEADVEEQYGPSVDAVAPMEVFVIGVGALPVGVIQRYRQVDWPEWDEAVGVPGAAGIDYLIGEPDHLRRGIGTAAITAFARLVLDRYPEVDAVVAAPQLGNRPSCRALERAGFDLVTQRCLGWEDAAGIYLLPRPGRLVREDQ